MNDGRERTSTQPVAVPTSSSSSSTSLSLQPHPPTGRHTPLTTPMGVPVVLGEEHPCAGLLNEVDVTIRIAFVQFLFDVELLGLIDQHLCIYRLFPRPVVALRNSAFLSAYKTAVGTTDVKFIQELIKTQVRYVGGEGGGEWAWFCGSRRKGIDKASCKWVGSCTDLI